MKYTKRYLFSKMENSYLDFQGLKLTNEDFEECLKIFQSLFLRILIRNIEITGNNIQKYNCSNIKKIFPNLTRIYSSDINSIDTSLTPDISIIVK